MMGYYDAYGWTSWMVILMLVWPLVIAATIWAVVAITRDHSRPHHAARETPLEALKRRFAEGDITQQEYLDSREILNNDARGDVPRS